MLKKISDTFYIDTDDIVWARYTGLDQCIYTKSAGQIKVTQDEFQKLSKILDKTDKSLSSSPLPRKQV